MTVERLAVDLPGLHLKNPVMPASGTFGFGDVSTAKQYDLNALGAMVIKTTTPEPRDGNPQPQIAMVRDGVMNSVGLQNPGVDVVVSEKLPQFKAKYPELPMIASVGGNTMADYVTVTEKLSHSGLVDALELNISCPNVQHGGLAFGTDPEMVETLTRQVVAASEVPIYVKLSPNVTDIVMIAKAAEAGGASGLVMINTLLGLHIDLETKRPVLGNGMGGFSGGALLPLAIRMIYQVHQVVALPIIGVGGIQSADDVLEMFLAGASAVQVGSAHFTNATIMPEIIDALPERMAAYGIQTLKDIQPISF
ncbi:MAG: dihydroorotate dehydrogenase [Aerococcus sp.]|nr:dihydroorotate dehydrogenase [Aerococcus sp.]